MVISGSKIIIMFYYSAAMVLTLYIYMQWSMYDIHIEEIYFTSLRDIANTFVHADMHQLDTIYCISCPVNYNM